MDRMVRSGADTRKAPNVNCRMPNVINRNRNTGHFAVAAAALVSSRVLKSAEVIYLRSAG